MAIEEPFGCQHEYSALRVFTASNGVLHYRKQCLRCGAPTGSVRKTNLPCPADMVPPWDEQLRERWYERQRALFQERRDEHEAERDEERQEWRRRYEQHLLSPEWQALRRKVFARARGLCEGCAERQARQVHHLTYEHMGHEFLFELVALCPECHGRLHEAEMVDKAVAN